MDGLAARSNRPMLALGTIVLIICLAIAGFLARSQPTMPSSLEAQGSTAVPPSAQPGAPADDRKSELNKHLTDLQYRVTAKRETEPPFTEEKVDHQGVGLYKCIRCKASLFDSRAKYESGTGWPSFYEPIEENAVDSRIDGSLLDQRTEVICRKCQAHLGHVYGDGPRPTGLRYSINSAALAFEATMAPKKAD